MPALVPLLASTVFWVGVVVLAVGLLPVALLLWALEAPRGRRRPLLHRLTCGWVSLCTLLNPWWPTTLHGQERLAAGPVVLVSNHLSLVDIVALCRLGLRTHFTWISKAENFRVPVIGWWMCLNAYIPLRRGDRTSVEAMLARAERDLRQGQSLLLFPEGTRSRDGLLRPFKTGAFELALRAGVPVQPVVVRGSFDALPPRGAVLRGRHPITVEVLDPVPLQAGDTPELLAERVRALYLDHVAA